jgi:hypothetical protein
LDFTTVLKIIASVMVRIPAFSFVCRPDLFMEATVTGFNVLAMFNSIAEGKNTRFDVQRP